VLVDEELLLDCGPDAPRAAARHGVELGRVRHLLLGHTHPDHAALSWRWCSSVAADELTVVAPPAVIAQCRDFLAAHAGAIPPSPAPAPIRFVPASPGEVVALGG
jgi:adenosylcobinamide kinase/adenosylcobinamide-phosphate guanylyltransferase